VSRPPLPVAVQETLARQDGVIARAQALELGLRPHDLARLRRRREWSSLRPGIFVDHTGEPSWRQLAWAAVLGHWPAGLFGRSALTESGNPSEAVHVAIDRTRGRPRPVPGVVVHFVCRLDEKVRWNLSPPRMRVEEAVLDVAAAAATDVDAVAVLAGACGSRRTTAPRLLDVLAGRKRMARRAWIEAVLCDVAAGTHSVLEHRYLALERAHGLPAAMRQRREVTAEGVVYRDASYGATATVELDGRAAHGRWDQRESDLKRDLETAATGGTTVRLGFRQLFGEGCRTLALVVRFLRSRGIGVDAHPCHEPDCPVR
jgi:hypothetical protein